MIRDSYQKGFTLLEVMLSIAAIAIIAGVSIPVYQSFQVKNDLDIAANTIAQVFHRAQLLSQSGEGDSSWGVNISSGSITLFRGTSYASRDQGYDETYQMPLSLSPSGLSEVVFEKLTGLAQSTGTAVLTATTSETKSITINSKGTISY